MDCMKSLLSGIGCCLLTLPVYPPPLCSQNETVNQIENLNVKTSRPDDHIIVRPATNTQLRSSEITFPLSQTDIRRLRSRMAGVHLLLFS